MLALLPGHDAIMDLFPDCLLDLNFDQCLVKGTQKVARLCRSVKVISLAYDHTYSHKLLFYRRINFAGRCEAGVIYGPGPYYKSWKIFPKEMLRLFSIDQVICHTLAKIYYTDLVKEKRFRRQN